ncbi:MULTISPECIES: peptidoglycan DD-metalloendopeptidase family protein [Mesonia]|uniref:Uncharacterized protein n=1 Tax=Mesonia oceanica TaxID=2687242 RepID=A0AC61YAX6_9FLAO|nr:MULTISPECIES: peptidoglycan DD-metalloendopeptidase family protein [Mesonia]MBJ96595.1 peptidase M23 [Flavobacteriaceae bacterium]MAN25823.1 peptidase M23 [Mesonia sp.]MAN29043.1 peptidase M23 [Mesonia sp.]MAQ40108.1 peptidase M23 [Mesonia sp.]VVV01288.1 hypothetical protein FVB9532_02578 [Mesonia oceanica]|tara:strand:- start:5581 stop:6261 length:681 start_codon:yes stop_codon:yes gene_type:complete
MIFTEYLAQLTSHFTAIVGDFQPQDYLALDLSVENKELKKINLSSPEAMQNYIQLQLDHSAKKVAFGGYLEKRNLYKRSEHFSSLSAEDRNIHIGLDIWAPASTSIQSPLDGKIHSFQNNTNFGDYGPTIILEHYFQGIQFYTLYGHLSLGSLEGLEVGQQVEGGQRIADLGGPEINGDYAPHLHFQVIKNIQEKTGDYPGVCSKNNLVFYAENCPDPNVLLKIML